MEEISKGKVRPVGSISPDGKYKKMPDGSWVKIPKRTVHPETKSNLEVNNGKVKLYHYSHSPLDIIDPKHFGKNSYTPERNYQKTPTSFFYVKEKDKEYKVGNVRYTVDIPLSKLYDFNKDPKKYFPQAKDKFKKDFPNNQIFTPQRQREYMMKLAKKDGYTGMIFKWHGSHRVDTFVPIKPNFELNYKVRDNLTKREKSIEKRFLETINSNPEKAMKEYQKKYGNFLSTDTAKELSKDYLKNPAENANAVQKVASGFNKYMFKILLNEEPKKGRDNRVLFTAGGSGAGKTSSLEQDTGEPHIIHDGNLANIGTALKHIETTLKAGKDAHIVYTYRDPFDSWANGVIPRAVRGKNGLNRTVPLEAVIRTHMGSLNVFRELRKKFKGNEKVVFGLTDNSRGKNNAVKITSDSAIDKFVEDIKMNENELRKKFKDELERQRKEGKLTPSIYRGLKGETEKTEKGEDISAIGRGASSENGGSIEQEELEKSISSNIYNSRRKPIGTVTNGYKKVAEGKWVKVGKGKRKSKMEDDTKKRSKKPEEVSSKNKKSEDGVNKRSKKTEDRSTKNIDLKVKNSKSKYDKHHQRMIDQLNRKDAVNIARIHSKNGGSSTIGGKPIPKGGYLVSPYEDREHKIEGKTISPTEIKNYMDKNSDLLSKENHVMGTWYNPEDGNTYLDISIIEKDQKKAEKIALDNNQWAIFDNSSMKPVNIQNRDEKDKEKGK